MVGYGVKSTPALVVDETVVLPGRVPTASQVPEILAPMARWHPGRRVQAASRMDLGRPLLWPFAGLIVRPGDQAPKAAMWRSDPASRFVYTCSTSGAVTPIVADFRSAMSVFSTMLAAA